MSQCATERTSKTTKPHRTWNRTTLSDQAVHSQQCVAVVFSMLLLLLVLRWALGIASCADGVASNILAITAKVAITGVAKLLMSLLWL